MRFIDVRDRTVYNLRMSRLNSLNEHAFDNLQCESTLYWLGFLCADGCLQKKTNQIVLKLAIIDTAHVIAFQKFMGSSHKLTITKQGKAALSQFRSNILHKKLSELGISPYKSKEFYCPSELTTSRHFWRGVVDGDGHLNYADKRKSYLITLAGNRLVCEAFRLFVTNQGINSKANVCLGNGGGWYSITFKGGLLAPKVIDLLYTGATVYLERKYQLAMELLEHFGVGRRSHQPLPGSTPANLIHKLRPVA